MIYQRFSKRQILAMTWWNRPAFKHHDAIVCDGAIRTGKTMCMADGFVLWSMSTFNGQCFAICGKTIASLRRNVILQLPHWLGDLFQITERRGDNRLTITDGKRTNYYYLFGGRDESSYSLIQGITLAGVLLDEVALMPRSFVEQACARCSVPGSKLWFNCNPGGPEHWFYKEWILDKKKKNALHLHFTMEDNLALDPEVKSRYENMYNGAFYRRYIQGDWCVAEGLIYPFEKQMYVVQEAVPQEMAKRLNLTSQEILKKYGEWYISCDYGTLNPFSAGLWWVCEGRAVRVAEYYYSGREKSSMKTDEEYYTELEKLAGDRPIRSVIVDPSAASFIAAIRRHGRFAVRKAKNNVLPGIRLTATMLKAGVIRIHEDCADAIREFGLYRWEEKGEVDKPIKENDHAMDDIRYFCSTVMRRDRIVKENLKGLTDDEED